MLEGASTDFVSVPSSVAELTELLQSHGIDTDKYGKDAAKPLHKLLKECATKRCSFKLDPSSSKLRRIVRVLECRFFSTEFGNQRILIEAREQSTDGWEKQKNRLPAKKMFAEDTVRDAAEKICKDELRVEDLSGLEVVEHKDPIQRAWESESYPGLQSVYITFTATVLMGGLPQQNTFSTPNIEDSKLNHVWEWIDSKEYHSSLDEKKRYLPRNGKVESKESLAKLVNSLEVALDKGERRLVLQKLLRQLYSSIENEEHIKVLLEAGVLKILTKMINWLEKSSAASGATPESSRRCRMPLTGKLWRGLPLRLTKHAKFKLLAALALWADDLQLLLECLQGLSVGEEGLCAMIDSSLLACLERLEQHVSGTYVGKLTTSLLFLLRRGGRLTSRRKSSTAPSATLSGGGSQPGPVSTFEVAAGVAAEIAGEGAAGGATGGAAGGRTMKHAVVVMKQLKHAHSMPSLQSVMDGLTAATQPRPNSRSSSVPGLAFGAAQSTATPPTPPRLRSSSDLVYNAHAARRRLSAAAVAATAAHAERAGRDLPAKQKHVMFSYAWHVQKQVLQIREGVKAAGFRTWIDVHDMKVSDAALCRSGFNEPIHPPPPVRPSAHPPIRSSTHLLLPPPYPG
jgi:hypothetical protein